MANHKSAEKRHRQSIKRRTRNRIAKASVRTIVKGVRSAIEASSPSDAKASLRLAEKAIAKAAGKHILPKKTARRQISRLAKKVAKVGKGV